VVRDAIGGMMGGNVMETMISAFLNLALLVGVASSDHPSRRQ
jgi:hypothetical protein